LYKTSFALYLFHVAHCVTLTKSTTAFKPQCKTKRLECKV